MVATAYAVVVSSGITPDFSGLSLCLGYVAHVFLALPPLYGSLAGAFASDLHVLATPPAFDLSQDQTLHLKFDVLAARRRREIIV